MNSVDLTVGRWIPKAFGDSTGGAGNSGLLQEFEDATSAHHGSWETANNDKDEQSLESEMDICQNGERNGEQLELCAVSDGADKENDQKEDMDSCVARKEHEIG